MQIPDLSILSSWPPPNYINPETRGPGALISVSVLLSLVTVLLAIRIYTRLWISRGFGLDDSFIILAYIPTLAFAIISYFGQIDLHWGRHVWDVPTEDFSPSLQASLASQLLFDLSTSLTKLSMLALLWRLISVDGGRYRYVVIAIASLVTIDGITFFFITLFQCSPPQAYWTLSVTPQKCIDEQIHLLVAGCINTFTDFLIVLVPIPFVVKLKLPRKQQIIVGSLFAGGLFATAAGAARTAITFKFSDDLNADRTWATIPIIIVSSLELYVGIICASIPPTKPFFARFIPQLFGSSISWLSRTGQSRGTFRRTMDQKLGPDFWMATQDRKGSPSSRDIESSPEWVMQMRPEPLMPGMPTPMRPPRTQSTLRSISIDEPSYLEKLRPHSRSSNTTTSTGILLDRPDSLTPQPLNLNKPLPTPRLSMDMDEPFGGEQQRAVNGSSTSSSTKLMSVYKLVPYEDGHMSVHRTKERGHNMI